MMLQCLSMLPLNSLGWGTKDLSVLGTFSLPFHGIVFSVGSRESEDHCAVSGVDLSAL